jgi:hypothetical protein
MLSDMPVRLGPKHLKLFSRIALDEAEMIGDSSQPLHEATARQALHSE